MRVCFLSPEVFAWGTHGGFGYLTRILSSELVKKGIEVCLVTKRRSGQKEVEVLDGVTVYSYPRVDSSILNLLYSNIKSLNLFKLADADIYHSQAVSYNSIFAKIAMPKKRHLITFQDPYDLHEWRRLSSVEPKYRLTPWFKTKCVVEAHTLALMCHKADALFTQARFLIPKVQNLYKLNRVPLFLPNPVYVPRRRLRKATHPTICFLARWDPQKRVRRYFDLAKKFPNVEFIAMGHSHNLETDSRLRERYSHIPNLTLTGFVSEIQKSHILENSWALVNTSIREALPVSFLEALAHATPIISGEDPDRLTFDYGYPVINDNYEETIRSMLKNDDWLEKGRRGRAHVKQVYDVERVVNLHIDAYKRLLEVKNRA